MSEPFSLRFLSILLTACFGLLKLTKVAAEKQFASGRARGRLPQAKKLLVAILASLLVSGCQGSLIKQAATSFDKATQSAVKGAESLLADYDREQMWQAANANQAAGLTRTQVSAAVKYDGHEDTAARMMALTALKLYAESLGSLASIGSAKANGESLTALGSAIKQQTGSDNAETYGKIVGKLASLITDARVGAKVGSLAREADSSVQALAQQLSDEIALIGPTIRANLNARFTRINKAHRDLSCPAQCNAIQNLRANELLLEMNRLVEQGKEVPNRASKIQDALEAMSKAHASLTKKASGADKKLIRESISAYIKAANDLQDLLIKLEA